MTLSSAPTLVDLSATLRFPSLPDTESAAELAHAATAGGFGTVCVAPVGPLTGADALLSFARTVENAGSPAPRFVFAPSPLRASSSSSSGSASAHAAAAAAATGTHELAEIYTLANAGVPVRALRLLSPVDDALLMRRALELACALDLVVMLPSTDKALAHGGVLVESAVATRLGLPAIPESSETIGVARLIELARLTRARVHVTHVFTASGVELIANAQRAGVAVTGCVAVTHLVLDERAHLEHRYDVALRVWPPLPTAASRTALIDAVKAGVLCVSSGHSPAPKRERDLEMTAATPGRATLADAWTELRTVVDEKTALRALGTAPAQVLKLDRVRSGGAM